MKTNGKKRIGWLCEKNTGYVTNLKSRVVLEFAGACAELAREVREFGAVAVHLRLQAPDLVGHLKGGSLQL